MPEHINGNSITHDKMKPANRSLRSREMNEVISVKPGFIVNWGMFIMLFVMIAGISLTAFIKLPDTIPVNLSFNDSLTHNQAWGYIPARSIHTVLPGQKVLLKTGQQDNVIAEGTVSTVAAAATDSGYRVNVSFPHPPAVKDIAKADINIGEYSLLSRLFSNLVPSFKNKEK